MFSSRCDFDPCIRRRDVMVKIVNDFEVYPPCHERFSIVETWMMLCDTSHTVDEVVSGWSNLICYRQSRGVRHVLLSSMWVIVSDMRCTGLDQKNTLSYLVCPTGDVTNYLSTVKCGLIIRQSLVHMIVNPYEGGSGISSTKNEE